MHVYIYGVSIYGARGRRDKQSYHYVHKTWDGDIISFIAVDACPDPGPRRPFNFFGVLTQVSQLSLSIPPCVGAVNTTVLPTAGGQTGTT